MIKYEYTQVNRLKKPHNYMYTPYSGLEFLDTYLEERLAYLDNIKRSGLSGSSTNYISLYAKSCRLLMDYTEISGHRDKLEEIFASDASNAYQSQSNKNIDMAPLPSFNTSNIVHSENLLVSLLDSQVNGGDQKLIKFWLDLLVQKFEVTKKIYHHYPINFGKGLGPNDSIEVYWMLILSLSLLFSSTKNIKYLNTMLKISDLLCSLDKNTVFKNIPKNHFGIVLLVELSGVKSLSERAEGVFFDFT